MSTTLSYVWIKKFRCLENVEFQLDDKVRITYQQKNTILKFEKNQNPLPEGFWDKDERIQGIHAVVGNNGKGKTTFLKAILEIITQLYLPVHTTLEEYKVRAYVLEALLVVKNMQTYKVLNMGVDVGKINKAKFDVEMIYEKLKIYQILKDVKVAFFLMCLTIRIILEKRQNI